jgi:hypothetical protein
LTATQQEATVSALIVSAQGGAGERGASQVRLQFLSTHLQQYSLNVLIFGTSDHINIVTVLHVGVYILFVSFVFY